jgi:hypothetical protein
MPLVRYVFGQHPIPGLDPLHCAIRDLDAYLPPPAKMSLASHRENLTGSCIVTPSQATVRSAALWSVTARRATRPSPKAGMRIASQVRASHRGQVRCNRDVAGEDRIASAWRDLMAVWQCVGRCWHISRNHLIPPLWSESSHRGCTGMLSCSPRQSPIRLVFTGPKSASGISDVVSEDGCDALMHRAAPSTRSGSKI